VDKEAKKPAKQPGIFLLMHKPAPSSVPLANPSLFASLSKPLTNSLILLFFGPRIQIIKMSSMMSQRRIKFVFVGNVGEALEEAFGKDVVEK